MWFFFVCILIPNSVKLVRNCNFLLQYKLEILHPIYHSQEKKIFIVNMVDSYLKKNQS